MAELFAKVLRPLLAKRGTARRLAEKCEVDDSTITSWHRAKNPQTPREDTLEAILDFFPDSRAALRDAWERDSTPGYLWEELEGYRATTTLAPTLAAVIAQLAPAAQEDLARFATRLLKSGFSWPTAIDMAASGFKAAAEVRQALEDSARSGGSGGPVRRAPTPPVQPPRGEIGPLGGSK